MTGRRGFALGALVLVGALAACGREERSAPSVTSAGCRAGAQVAPLRGVRRDLKVGGEVRSYLLDVPAGPADEPRPVVLAFHGFRAAPPRPATRRILGFFEGQARPG